MDNNLWIKHLLYPLRRIHGHNDIPSSFVKGPARDLLALDKEIGEGI